MSTDEAENTKLNILPSVFRLASPSTLFWFAWHFAAGVLLPLNIPNDTLSRVKKSRQVSATWGSIFPGKTSLVLSIYTEPLQGCWASRIKMNSINCHYLEIHVRSCPCFSIWQIFASFATDTKILLRCTQGNYAHVLFHFSKLHLLLSKTQPQLHEKAKNLMAMFVFFFVTPSSIRPGAQSPHYDFHSASLVSVSVFPLRQTGRALSLSPSLREKRPSDPAALMQINWSFLTLWRC